MLRPDVRVLLVERVVSSHLPNRQLYHASPCMLSDQDAKHFYSFTSYLSLQAQGEKSRVAGDISKQR